MPKKKPINPVNHHPRTDWYVGQVVRAVNPLKFPWMTHLDGCVGVVVDLQLDKYAVLWSDDNGVLRSPVTHVRVRWFDVDRGEDNLSVRVLEAFDEGG